MSVVLVWRLKAPCKPGVVLSTGKVERFKQTWRTIDHLDLKCLIMGYYICLIYMLNSRNKEEEEEESENDGMHILIN